MSPSDLLQALSPDSELWKPEASTSGSVESFSLPPHTTLLLADVDAGSNTPSMVGKVLKWRKAAGTAGAWHIIGATTVAESSIGEDLWISIAAVNAELGKIVAQLNRAAKDDSGAYETAVKSLAAKKAAHVCSATRYRLTR